MATVEATSQVSLGGFSGGIIAIASTYQQRRSIVVGGIITIIFGLLLAICGPVAGVTISARDSSGRRRSAKVYGSGAAVIGVMIIIYGIYLLASGA